MATPLDVVLAAVALLNEQAEAATATRGAAAERPREWEG
jgi:hypothetical protein